MIPWEKIKELASVFVPKILLAIVIFVVGYALIRLVLRMVNKTMSRSKHIDPTILPFVLTLSKIVLMVLLLLVCADSVDISVTPLITALGAVGVAVSLALKDSLANLLGGSIYWSPNPLRWGIFAA